MVIAWRAVRRWHRSVTSPPWTCATGIVRGDAATAAPASRGGPREQRGRQADCARARAKPDPDADRAGDRVGRVRVAGASRSARDRPAASSMASTVRPNRAQVAPATKGGGPSGAAECLEERKEVTVVGTGHGDDADGPRMRWHLACACTPRRCSPFRVDGRGSRRLKRAGAREPLRRLSAPTSPALLKAAGRGPRTPRTRPRAAATGSGRSAVSPAVLASTRSAHSSSSGCTGGSCTPISGSTGSLEFQRYWVEELGNRPLQPHDFYFLSGVYRQRLQSIDFEQLSRARARLRRQATSTRGAITASSITCSPTRTATRSRRYACTASRDYVPRGGRVAEYRLRHRADARRRWPGAIATSICSCRRRHPAPALPLRALEVPRLTAS